MKALDQFRLEGRVALVTGAARGLGRALAMGLAEAGADVCVAGRGPGLDELAAGIQRSGRRALALPADLADPAQPARIAAEAEKAFGKVDILVNNAGIVHRSPALEHSAEGWDEVLQVNLKAAFALSQAVARGMCARRSGKIVNVASVLSFQGGINVAAYTASKAALAGLTKALANEWAAQGVNVNAIAPGYMATDLTAVLRDDQKRNRQISERIPAGRWGQPEDLVGAVIYLASPASDYVHGHVLVVDGGWLAR